MPLLGVDYVAYALWVKWVLQREVRVKLARGPSTMAACLGEGSQLKRGRGRS